MSARSSEVHRVGFITLGCPKNEADTARMRTLLHGSNFEVVDEVELADIAIINTCGFITSATEESLECIFDTVRDWLPARRGRHIVVVGCLASRYGTELSDELSEVSLCLGVNDERDIVAHLERLVAGQDGRDETPEVVGDTGPHDERTKSSLSVENRRKARGPSEYVMIADGCDRACSYCTIPSIRGPYASRPISAIAAEVESLIASGAREIVLVAQDTTQYGKDLAEDASLVKLIDTLCALPDPFWLRVMYMQPEGIDEELLECFARNHQMCHYFEIPMQHASARILRAMQRAGDGEHFLGLLDRIRSRFPDAVVRTTLIAGYPGETDEEFEELVDFIGKARFDYVGVFAYSPEEGTVAAKSDGQLSDEVRLSRANELRAIADAIGFEQTARWIDTTLEVLLEDHLDTDQWQGRFPGQAPDIDGVVLVGVQPGVELESGMIVTTKIDDAYLYDLEGMISLE